MKTNLNFEEDKSSSNKSTKFYEKPEKLLFEKIFPNVKEIVYISFFLAILLLVAAFEYLVPSLPFGAGIADFLQISLIFGVLVLGFKIGIFAILIYLLVFATSLPFIFASGVIIFPGEIDKAIGIYFLDYFIPLISIAFLGIFYKTKIWIKITIGFCALILTWMSHAISGYVFFSVFTPTSFPGGVHAYIWLFNLVGLSTLFLLLVPLVFASHKLQPIILRKLSLLKTWNN
ncbi:hypothetical protein [[Mycoplasma] mobile]|nr:hypothetical protein [[Mycoplasma] mobile]